MNTPAITSATQAGMTVMLAFAIADRQALKHLQAVPTELAPMHHWRDTRPLLDEREVASGQGRDLWQQLLDYAEFRRLIVRHRHQHYLVRINRSE